MKVYHKILRNIVCLGWRVARDPEVRFLSPTPHLLVISFLKSPVCCCPIAVQKLGGQKIWRSWAALE